MSRALLLAEAEPGTRDFLERHLVSEGFEVLGAGAQDLALELIERARPDLVLASLAAEALEGRIGLRRRSVAAFDPVGTEQPAERLGLGLAGHHRNANGLVFHAASLAS